MVKKAFYKLKKICVMLIGNIRHTGIVVDDLIKSLEFYTKKLGFKVSNRVVKSGPFINKILGFKDIRVTIW